MIGKVGYSPKVTSFKANSCQKNPSFGTTIKLSELRDIVTKLKSECFNVDGIEPSSERLKDLAYYQGLLIKTLNKNLFDNKFLPPEKIGLTHVIDNLTEPTETIAKSSTDANIEVLNNFISEQGILIKQMENTANQTAIAYRAFTYPFPGLPKD